MAETTITLPVLHHAESRLLFSEGLEWSAENLQQVLNLPRLTLIADLETIVTDTKTRASYYEAAQEEPGNEKVNDAPLNAIMLLGELQAVEALPTVLNWLTADMHFLDIWLGDHITETMWEPLFKMLPAPPEAIESFLKNTEAYEFARSAMSSALGQLVLYRPEQRNYALSIFQNVFNYYLQLPDEVDETLFVGMAIHKAEDINAIELWPVIEKLFDTERVDEFSAGTKTEALNEIQDHSKPDYYFREVLPVKERFQKIITSWYSYTGKEDFFIDNPVSSSDDDWANWKEEDDDEPIQMPVVRTEPKIGRNDPCLCGSGKKYKKCCLSKLEG